jgi:hypothetical protein
VCSAIQLAFDVEGLRPVLHSDTGEQVKGSWEPLWDEALWERIQAVRQRQFRGSNGGRVRFVYPSVASLSATAATAGSSAKRTNRSPIWPARHSASGTTATRCL